MAPSRARAVGLRPCLGLAALQLPPAFNASMEVASGDLAQWPVASLRTRRDGEEWLAADYLSMLGTAAPAFGRLFSQLAADGALPAVVHCLAGKDRTGMAVALLLTALGVDRVTVLDDYELTSDCHASRVPEVVEVLAELGIAGQQVRGS